MWEIYAYQNADSLFGASAARVYRMRTIGSILAGRAAPAARGQAESRRTRSGDFVRGPGSGPARRCACRRRRGGRPMLPASATGQACMGAGPCASAADGRPTCGIPRPGHPRPRPRRSVLRMEHR